jgi:WS/DGAT/MGAT family acyltransferase
MAIRMVALLRTPKANYERLSALDASFLYVESPVDHMHVASLAFFEDTGAGEEELNAHIESRLALVPRFRKKLKWVPFGADRPVWIDDPHFDIRFHIRHTGLPKPGGEREALRLMGRLISTPLDRRRPLWEMWMVDLPGDRKAVIQKTHHCLIDGISGVDLGTVILDLSRDAPRRPPEPWTPEPEPTKPALLRDALLGQVRQPATMFRNARAFVSATPRSELARRSGDVARGVLALGKQSFDFAPQTSLSARIGPHRRFDIVRAELAVVKRLKNRFSCTVNDVVLASVAGGLGRLLRERGDNTDGLLLKAMVPVSVRDPSQRMTYGNMVSMMAADLPVGERHPVKRIEIMRDKMAGLKDSKQAVGADFWVKLSEYAPPTVLALAGRATALQRMVNLVVTNIPGPQFPLYLLGGQMLEAFPCVPIFGTASLGVAILSYNGHLSFGVTGDYDIVPDLHVLSQGIETSLLELCDAAGVRPE